MSSGVPQGSHLEPLLFSVYINDIAEVIRHSHFLLFADAMKLFNTINSPQDADEIQSDLHNIERWSTINGIEIILEKCRSMSFSRNKISANYIYFLQNRDICQTNLVNDLGIWIDSRLKFETHIDKITAKALKLLGFLKEINQIF